MLSNKKIKWLNYQSPDPSSSKSFFKVVIDRSASGYREQRMGLEDNLETCETYFTRTEDDGIEYIYMKAQFLSSSVCPDSQIVIPRTYTISLYRVHYETEPKYKENTPKKIASKTIRFFRIPQRGYDYEELEVLDSGSECGGVETSLVPMTIPESRMNLVLRYCGYSSYDDYDYASPLLSPRTYHIRDMLFKFPAKYFDAKIT